MNEMQKDGNEYIAALEPAAALDLQQATRVQSIGMCSTAKGCHQEQQRPAYQDSLDILS